MKGDYESLYLVPKEVYQTLWKNVGEGEKQSLRAINSQWEPSEKEDERDASHQDLGQQEGPQEKEEEDKEEKEEGTQSSHGLAGQSLLPEREVRQAKKKGKEKENEKGARRLHLKTRGSRIPNLIHLNIKRRQ